MKKQLIIATLALAASTAGYAANENSNMKPGMMMGMMSHEQMMQVQNHLEQMQKLMGDIKMEHDPGKRMQMMNEHLKQMNQTMGMMGGGMMGATGNKNVGNMSMQERMDMMQAQMGMMQAMMGQMMQHYSQAAEDEDDE